MGASRHRRDGLGRQARRHLGQGRDRLWRAPARPPSCAKGDEALQPVLLSADPEPANAARNIALADGAWRDDALTFKRAFYFFDQSTIADARTCWKKLKGTDGVEPRFWRQEGGRWMEGP
jgi:DNA polymerase IIIc chi subunit